MELMLAMRLEENGFLTKLNILLKEFKTTLTTKDEKRSEKVHNLIVEKKNVYGVERVYPVCKKAKLFARISGNITLLDEDRKLIAELGYTFSTKAEEIK